jgi:hypothetical protein
MVRPVEVVEYTEGFSRFVTSTTAPMLPAGATVAGRVWSPLAAAFRWFLSGAFQTYWGTRCLKRKLSVVAICSQVQA